MKNRAKLTLSGFVDASHPEVGLLEIAGIKVHLGRPLAGAVGDFVEVVAVKNDADQWVGEVQTHLHNPCENHPAVNVQEPAKPALAAMPTADASQPASVTVIPAVVDSQPSRIPRIPGGPPVSVERNTAAPVPTLTPVQTGTKVTSFFERMSAGAVHAPSAGRGTTQAAPSRPAFVSGSLDDMRDEDIPF